MARILRALPCSRSIADQGGKAANLDAIWQLPLVRQARAIYGDEPIRRVLPFLIPIDDAEFKAPGAEGAGGTFVGEYRPVDQFISRRRFLSGSDPGWDRRLLSDLVADRSCVGATGFMGRVDRRFDRRRRRRDRVPVRVFPRRLDAHAGVSRRPATFRSTIREGNVLRVRWIPTKDGRRSSRRPTSCSAAAT